MSQIYKSAGGGGGGSGTTLFTEDTGTASPSAGNVNIVGGPGIVTSGDSASTVTISIRNFLTGVGQTIGATTLDLITLNLGATPATYVMDARVAAFNALTPAGAGYNLFGSARTTGGAATQCGTTDNIDNEEAALVAADATILVSGNNMIVRVTGVAGLTIDWSAVALYTSII